MNPQNFWPLFSTMAPRRTRCLPAPKTVQPAGKRRVEKVLKAGKPLSEPPIRSQASPSSRSNRHFSSLARELKAGGSECERCPGSQQGSTLEVKQLRQQQRCRPQGKDPKHSPQSWEVLWCSGVLLDTYICYSKCLLLSNSLTGTYKAVITSYKACNSFG